MAQTLLIFNCECGDRHVLWGREAKQYEPGKFLVKYIAPCDGKKDYHTFHNENQFEHTLDSNTFITRRKIKRYNKRNLTAAIYGFKANKSARMDRNVASTIKYLGKRPAKKIVGHEWSDTANIETLLAALLMMIYEPHSPPVFVEYTVRPQD